MTMSNFNNAIIIYRVSVDRKNKIELEKILKIIKLLYIIGNKLTFFHCEKKSK